MLIAAIIYRKSHRMHDTKRRDATHVIPFLYSSCHAGCAMLLPPCVSIFLVCIMHGSALQQQRHAGGGGGGGSRGGSGGGTSFPARRGAGLQGEAIEE